jgi:DNA-binding transcriptional LysR family regulator
MKLVASGRFIGLCSYGYQYFNAQRLSVKILPLVLPVKPVPVAILTLKNRMPSPAAQLFIDAATEIASPLSKIIPA